jgi:glucose-1-phosphate cytidylyltransferase
LKIEEGTGAIAQRILRGARRERLWQDPARMNPRELTVVILCGGRGTRLQERTQSIPKPLVEIGGRPILWHVIAIYLAHGFGRFVLCTGYKRELIERFVAAEPWPPGVRVDCVDTGLETATGGRVRQAAQLLGGEPFCATYADGVADIDLHALLAAHRAHGDLATVTVVRPQLQFGVAELDAAGRVRGFREKPRAEQWANGGFFCFEPGVVAYLEEDSVLEREPLERLAAAGELHGYRHEGFWDCMDTYKDAVLLNDLWAEGRAPWMAPRGGRDGRPPAALDLQAVGPTRP